MDKADIFYNNNILIYRHKVFRLGGGGGIKKGFKRQKIVFYYTFVIINIISNSVYW